MLKRVIAVIDRLSGRIYKVRLSTYYSRDYSKKMKDERTNKTAIEILYIVRKEKGKKTKYLLLELESRNR